MSIDDDVTMHSHVRAFAPQVVLWDMNEAALTDVSKQVAEQDGSVWRYTVDVTDKKVCSYACLRSVSMAPFEHTYVVE